MNNLNHPPRVEVARAVTRALEEDLTPLGDLTSALLPVGTEAEARFVSRESGVLAGRACAAETFAQVDPTVELMWKVDDGDALEVGTTIASVRGSLASILIAERTALNFVCHLSGIATRVAGWIAATEGNLTVWDTRKTTPGLRSMEKAAVRSGGGVNHRGNLSDWVMFKDNHLTVLGIAEAVARARKTWPGRTVHVECDRLEQMVEAIDAGADIVLLDNMSPADVTECVALANEARASGAKLLVEISGGIDDENIASYARTGADLVSSGSLSNSSQNLDIGLDIDVSATDSLTTDP